jgi:hypothetical protein
MTHPIVAITDSSIDTSMNVPRGLALSAAAIANAAVMPPTVSAIG